MVYFIGNVLTSHEQASKHPERGKEHFHIGPDEAAEMDITGLPVHLEHADNVQVGKVERSWDDPDGAKWVLAHVDESTIEGKFVRNDLTADVPIYSGLSLQHVYRKYSDGTSAKEPREVSICKDPRRPGCNIIHCSGEATDTHGYKVSCHAHRHMTSSTAEPANTSDTNKTAPETVAEETTSASSTTPSATQLMAEVVEASRQNEELKKQLSEKTEALAAHESAKKEAEAKAIAQQSQAAQELGDAVLEHVAKLDPALANEDTTKAIDTLREKYPQQIARVLEVACCASKRASELEEQLKVAKADNERKLLEQAYHAAVATRTGCHGMPDVPRAEEIPVRASKRARADEPVNPFAVHHSSSASASGSYGVASDQTLQQIQEAYNGLKGSGSTTDAMKSVAGIIGQQRQRGFR